MTAPTISRGVCANRAQLMSQHVSSRLTNRSALNHLSDVVASHNGFELLFAAKGKDCRVELDWEVLMALDPFEKRRHAADLITNAVERVLKGDV